MFGHHQEAEGPSIQAPEDTSTPCQPELDYNRKHEPKQPNQNSNRSPYHQVYLPGRINIEKPFLDVMHVAIQRNATEATKTKLK